MHFEKYESNEYHYCEETVVFHHHIMFLLPDCKRRKPHTGLLDPSLIQTLKISHSCIMKIIINRSLRDTNRDMNMNEYNEGSTFTQ